MGTERNHKLNWGVIGCSKIAINAVLPAFQLSTNGRVEAVASRDRVKSQHTANQFGIPMGYGNYDELLADPEIDAVYLSLPNHLHGEWAIRSAEAGKHVLCEKPISLTSQEAERMVIACRKSGVLLVEAMRYRHNQKYDRIKEIIADGEIGKIRAIHGTFTTDASNIGENFRFHASKGGGSLYDLGCYLIHIARYVLEEEPEAATVHAFFSPDHGNVDMMSTGLLEFADGVALTFQCGMWAAGQNHMQITGTQGFIYIPSCIICRSEQDVRFEVHVNGNIRHEQVPFHNEYTSLIDDFSTSVLQDQNFRFDELDPVRNMEALEACLKSAKVRKRIIIR